jgi:hypothetical protein
VRKCQSRCPSPQWQRLCIKITSHPDLEATTSTLRTSWRYLTRSYPSAINLDHLAPLLLDLRISKNSKSLQNNLMINTVSKYSTSWKNKKCESTWTKLSI